MFRKEKLFGIVGVIFLIGLMLSGCMSTPYVRADPDLNGTWYIMVTEGEMTMTFNNSRWEEAINGLPTRRGFYTTSNGNINLTISEYHGRFPTLQRAGLASKWYSTRELRDEYAATFETPILTYSIDGDKLNILSSLGSDKPRTWTRKN